MSTMLELRCAPDDVAGLQAEVGRRDKIIRSLIYQVEHNLNASDTDYGLLQTTFMLEEQVRLRTGELQATLEDLRLARLSALAERQRLEAAVESISEGFALFDPDDRLLLCNQAYLRLWGLEQAPIGASFTELLLQAAARLDIDDADWLRRRIDGHRSASGSNEYALPGGLFVQVRERKTPDGYTVGVYSDITDVKREEARLRQQQQAELLKRQQLIFDNAGVGIVFLKDRNILNCNQRMAEIFGFPSSADLIGQSTVVLYMSPEHWEQDGTERYAELADKGFSDDEVVMRRRDGSQVWCHRTGRPVDPMQPMQGSIWVFDDISEKRQAVQELHLAHMVFENSSEGIIVTDAHNVIVSVNGAFTRISGYSREEAIGKTPGILKSGIHDHDFYAEMWRQLLAHGHWAGEIIDRRKTGELYPKYLSISVVRDGCGAITNYVAAFIDITERKVAEEKIRFLAHHDALTGLPNRVLLADRFEQMKRRAARSGGLVAICFLDLDQFKQVNDTLGHRAGDQMLVEIARRLCATLRESETVSRFGGDEFVLLLEGANSPAQVVGTLQRIFQALEVPVEAGGRLLSISSSIGVAIYPNDGDDFDALLQKADTAMYHSKDRGRATFSFFDDRMNRDTASRLDIAMRLRKALERREFYLVYQPQFSLADNRVVGVEALLRWHTASHGEESPARFIPVAEETGQIIGIGAWVLEEACRQAHQWSQQGSPLRMAINVSAVQIYRDDFIATLSRVLADTGVDPALIEVEITESTVMADTDTIREVFERLSALGVSVAIDDFGTGYSSLAYLRRFHVGKLKVDRSFVNDLPHDDEARAIAEAIVRMGQSLRLTVIAEGVETAEQQAFLDEIGCDEIQGYVLARPMRREQLAEFLEARRTGA